MKLRPLALALALGIFWGASVLLATWWLLIVGSPGTTIGKLEVFYFGYGFSYLGGVIGLFWGFIDGFIVGYIVALLYNAFVRERAPIV